MARVLIIGASRGIGLEAVRQALDAGHAVRAFSRSASRLAISHPVLEKVNGDALSKADVAAAAKGMDAVIQVLGVGTGDLFRPVHLFSDATRILIDAMTAAGVKRLIAVTGYGAGDSHDSLSLLERIPFRLLLGRAYDDKSAQERMIVGSALDWTIARPGVLTNGARTGRYQVLAKPSTWHNGVISRADVADFLVRQIDDRSLLRQAPVLVR
jgi:putative NADH-flavin reductase